MPPPPDLLQGQGEEEGENPPLDPVTFPSAESIERVINSTHAFETTALHVLDDIITQLQSLHTDINSSLLKKRRQKMETYNTTLLDFQSRIKASRDPLEKEDLNNQYLDFQRDIKNDIEAKDTASSTRIANFYKSQTGKNVPITFQCVNEPRRSRDIYTIETQTGRVEQQDQIIQVMQDWYQHTANTPHEQTLSLASFLEQHNIILPQISQEESEHLEAPFSPEEVYDAIKAAHENSASGPSGQSIAFYKLLFLEIPSLLTAAINQFTFVPHLAEQPRFHWIKQRKVIYIPKKNPATTPGDYRPLSMLEVLYKIPSRILAKRLSTTLPTIIGPNQFGFMKSRGIQEPTLIATHIIQEAVQTGDPVQLISHDVEKAFDKVGHTVIAQALTAFGIPQIAVKAITNLALIGYAQVEVNGRKGILFVIKVGSGQGDPLSSILFLIATEPLNRALSSLFTDIFYTSRQNITVGPMLYADDNLTAFRLQDAADIIPVQNLYAQYRQVSGLNINVTKSTALCINTANHVVLGLNELGFATPETISYLGVNLGKTIESTVQATIAKIQPKSIRKRILATTPPTDLLHKARLLNQAILPLYNHVFMALPIFNQQIQQTFDEILSFLWTKQVDGNTVNKRRLVSKNRIPASLEMGGLQIPHPSQTIQGLQQNMLQKIHRKERFDDFSHLSQILNGLLVSLGRPSLTEHIISLGPTEWSRTATRLKTVNQMFSQAFSSVGDLLIMQETNLDAWGSSAIIGHSLASKIFPFSPVDKVDLANADIRTVSQLFLPNDNGTLSRVVRANIPHIQSPRLIYKLNLLANAARKFNYVEIFPSARTILSTLMDSPRNISSFYRTFIRLDLDDKIKNPPSLQTRIRDNVAYPTPQIFRNAYAMIRNPMLPSKTKENSFQTLNRTLWTNNKAFKSRIIDSPACPYCGEVETMEHLLLLCDNYSACQWELLSNILTDFCRKTTPDAARIHVTFLNIIYNTEIPALPVHIASKTVRRMIQLLVHEIRRDIYYRKINLMPTHNGPVHFVRRAAHLLSVFKKVTSFLNYCSETKWAPAVAALDDFAEILRHHINDNE